MSLVFFVVFGKMFEWFDRSSTTLPFVLSRMLFAFMALNLGLLVRSAVRALAAKPVSSLRLALMIHAGLLVGQAVVLAAIELIARFVEPSIALSWNEDVLIPGLTACVIPMALRASSRNQMSLVVALPSMVTILVGVFLKPHPVLQSWSIGIGLVLWLAAAVWTWRELSRNPAAYRPLPQPKAVGWTVRLGQPRPQS